MKGKNEPTGDAQYNSQPTVTDRRLDGFAATELTEIFSGRQQNVKVWRRFGK